ncbi:hypothetical protein [Streptomyces sp. DASNCL29]|uniref:hypothetical protein n=1 Tax=Streptomyces sp. DASNCL29 TaxID=2583819 RepID=UPI00110FEE56|nr:hypothetical protein [Streptomyces sp. DASNCL29]TMU98112.1 hypothetical protein FGK60_09810 [Streptomyces sp. DASNCL29]
MTPRVCASCQTTTSQPVAVAVEHSASAGGRTIYACPGKCADSFPPQRDPFDRGTLMARYVPVRRMR